MKRTALFLAITAFIGLNVGSTAQAGLNPLAGINGIKNCKLMPEIDKTKLGVAIVAGSIAAAAGAEVFELLYNRAKSFCKFCNEHRKWALAGCGVLAGVYLIGAGSVQK